MGNNLKAKKAVSCIVPHNENLWQLSVQRIGPRILPCRWSGHRIWNNRMTGIAVVIISKRFECQLICFSLY